jgi:hypothetical protein
VFIVRSRTARRAVIGEFTWIELRIDKSYGGGMMTVILHAHDIGRGA